MTLTKKTYAVLPLALALMMVAAPFVTQAQRQVDYYRTLPNVVRIDAAFQSGIPPVPQDEPSAENAGGDANAPAAANSLTQNTAPPDPMPAPEANPAAVSAEPAVRSDAPGGSAAIAAPSLDVTPSTFNENSSDPYARNWPLSPDESQLLLELALVLGVVGFLCIEQRAARALYKRLAGIFAAPSQEAPQVLQGSER